MGEAGKDVLRLSFDRSIKLEFHGIKLSSNAGLFNYGDLDDAAQLTESGTTDLFDFSTGGNIQHNMTALLRQSIDSRVTASTPIKCLCNCMCWRTIWTTSYSGWRCHRA